MRKSSVPLLYSFCFCRIVEILSGFSEGKEEIDMTRMSNVISQRIIKLLNQVIKLGLSSVHLLP